MSQTALFGTAKKRGRGHHRLKVEIPEHLMIMRVLWHTVHIAFNITPPNSVSTLFEMCFVGIEYEIARHIRVGVCALLWAIWNCRNDLAFNRTTIIHFLQVLSRANALIRMWSLLTPTEARERLVTGSVRWEMVARDIFNRFGWRSCNRIGD